MKKFITLLLACVFYLSGNIYIVKAAEDPPTPSADSVVLMDATTETVLYSKNMDSAYPPASTTKIMTALLTLEKTKLADSVTVGRNPTFADGSAIGVREGEIFSVQDLLYGLLLESGNDCALALAEHISGSQEEFAKLMNERAKELGATNTNFVNPNGLYNKDHKTSAKDLALIMRELLKYPELDTISHTVFYKIEPTNKSSEPRYANNRNKLLLKNSSYYYEDAIGAKTGYTTESLSSYIVAAKRNGQTLIAAFIHDENGTPYGDAIKLLDYGFDNFELKKLFSKDDEISSTKLTEDITVPLLATEDFYYVAKKEDDVKPDVIVSQSIAQDTSFSKGEIVAEAKISSNDNLLSTMNLASGIDYVYEPPVTFVEKSTRIAINILKYIFYTVALLFLLLLTLAIVIRKRKLKRRLKGPKSKKIIVKKKRKIVDYNDYTRNY